MTEQAPVLFGVLPPASVVLILSALAAAIIGIVTIATHRHLARTRMAFDTLHRTNWDKDYIEKRRDFLLLRDSERGLEYYAADKPENAPEEQIKGYLDARATIQAVLNDRENLAIAVRQGILDEEYLFRYFRTAIIQDWEAASPLVAALRKRNNNPNIFIEFEGLANQWQNGRSYYRRRRRMRVSRRTVTIK